MVNDEVSVDIDLIRINCNDCTNIDYTEQEQLREGLRKIPEHHCMYYHARVLHLNHHSGANYYIYPCNDCIGDEYKYFKMRMQ